MKKTLLLTLLMAMAAGVFAQSQRMVLLEHFTQASCGPCATYNPLVKQYFDNTTTNATAIKYQTSWPGVDPMNAHNPADVQTRVNYYGVTGVPNVVIDGNYAQGNPGSLFAGGQSSDMDTRATDPSDFDITVTHQFTGASVDVTAVITATNAVTNANLKAHVVIVEKHIAFDNPPGSNGETDFYNVMKAMLPTSAGTDLGDVWNNGTTEVLQESWTLANVYKASELAAIVFVQDDVTKEVMQTNISSVMTSTLNLDAGITSTNPAGSAYGTVICNANNQPIVTLTNYGNTTLTSADINYSINGTQATYNWTGSIATFGSEEVTLPAIAYTPSAAGFNQFAAQTANPNGGADDYPANNNGSGFFEYVDYADVTEYKSNLTLTINTDQYGSETTWEFVDAGGNVLAAGPSTAYGNSQTYTESVTLPDGECYMFFIYDSYGDGICCGYGSGSYTLEDSDGTILIEQSQANGNPFNGSQKLTVFKTFNTTNTNTADLTESLSVYPNPAVDNFTIEFDLAEAAKLDINLMNAIGQKVRTIEAGNFNGGEHLINVSTADLNAGTYFISIRSEEGITTKTITVIK
jgi:hypothetical protein